MNRIIKGTKPNVSDLTPDTLLIRADVAKPGRVLLTHGGEVISHAISLLNDGEYSHAAVFATPLLIFESYNLVSYAFAEPIGTGKINGEEVRLAKLPHDPIRAKLFRHPSEGGIPASTFSEIYLKMMEEAWGEDYSAYWRLTRLAEIPNFLKPFLIETTRLLVDGTPIPGSNEGLFCSELVAMYYDRLKLPLFPETKEPKDVTPKHLTESLLEPVEGAIVRFSDVKEFQPLGFWDITVENFIHEQEQTNSQVLRQWWSSMQKREEAYARMFNGARELNGANDRLEKSIDDVIKTSQKMVKQGLLRQWQTMESLLRMALIEKREFLRVQIERSLDRLLDISIRLTEPFSPDPGWIDRHNAAGQDFYSVARSQTRCSMLAVSHYVRHEKRRGERERLLRKVRNDIAAHNQAKVEFVKFQSRLTKLLL